MNRHPKLTRRLLATVLLAGLCAHTLLAKEGDAPPPDFTRDGKPDASHDWLLGPTGARGWMFFRHEDLTAASRQILITAVEKGSPADGTHLPKCFRLQGIIGQSCSTTTRFAVHCGAQVSALPRGPM